MASTVYSAAVSQGAFKEQITGSRTRQGGISPESKSGCTVDLDLMWMEKKKESGDVPHFAATRITPLLQKSNSSKAVSQINASGGY